MKNILIVNRDKNNDTRSIVLFGKLIDFNKYYQIQNCPSFDMGDFCTEEDLQEVLSDYEKRNKKRKNKEPVIIYSRIPWYESIIIFDEWRGVIYGSIGLILGFLLGLQF